MVIRSFRDADAESFFKKGWVQPKNGWASVRTIVKRKLDMLHYASELKDLRSPPGNPNQTQVKFFSKIGEKSWQSTLHIPHILKRKSS